MLFFQTLLKFLFLRVSFLGKCCYIICSLKFVIKIKMEDTRERSKCVHFLLTNSSSAISAWWLKECNVPVIFEHVFKGLCDNSSSPRIQKHCVHRLIKQKYKYAHHLNLFIVLKAAFSRKITPSCFDWHSYFLLFI